MDCIICRYGELALKGKNRDRFEDRLVINIKACLADNDISGEVVKVRGRVFVYTKEVSALDHLRRVFGLVSISPAIVSNNDIGSIEKNVLDYVGEIVKKDNPSKFRVSTHRVNKKFPKKSNEIDILLGDNICTKFNLKVNLKNYDLDVGVEIHNRAFIFSEKIYCFGGLPLGMGGKVVCMIRNVNDVLAAWFFMRRGCCVSLFGDFDHSILSRFSYGYKIRIITSLKDASDCTALVVGDLLGDFNPDNYKEYGLTVLTPLIGFDKQMFDDWMVSIS
ncbi:hypothetical protein HQ545_03810 [Candidatus Woesearchaeota archaeon]|nr:hypothetical protein [Candidatus Woesearchaeota archaeon]